VETESADSITEGGLARPLFKLAWPIVAIQLLQVAYNIADTLFLGYYDTNALGALSLAFPLVFLVISVAGGFTTAGSILVAQYTGADSEGSAGHAAGQTISLVYVVGTVLAIVGFLLTRDLLAVLPSQEETAANVIPLAAEYMEIFFLGVPFVFGFFVFSALMRGYGDTKTPMRVMIVSVVLNVALDPLLIFGIGPFPELGVAGAAIATILSRGIATVIGLYVLFVTDSGPSVSVASLRPELKMVRKIVSLGVPSSAEQSASALAMVTLTGMVAAFAPPVVAAYGLGNRLISLVFLPAMGLGRATNTMVGQNLGAGKTDRAARAVRLAAAIGAGVMLVVAVVAALFPDPIVGVFVGTEGPDAKETLRLGSEYVRVRAVEFAFIGVLQVVLGAYRGAGNTKTALAFSLVALWIGRVPAVAFLAFTATVPVTVLGNTLTTIQTAGLGPTGIWIGMALGNVLGAIAAGAWFLRGTWKKAVVQDSSPPGSPGPDVADRSDD
jgi:putative MATE family efflux protein